VRGGELCRTERSDFDGGASTATVYTGPKTSQVVLVGSLRRVAVAAPRLPCIPSQLARRAVRESPVANRGPSLTLIRTPSRNSRRRAITSRTLNPATHNLSTAASACRWHVQPLSTAVWRHPTAVGVAGGGVGRSAEHSRSAEPTPSPRYANSLSTNRHHPPTCNEGSLPQPLSLR